MMDKPSNNNEIKNFLQSLKLTKYETEVYITLLKYGPQNYKEITKRSGVPYGKIYYTLKTLARKGWIESLNTRPRIFHATDPKEPLKNHLMQIKEQIHDLEELFQRMIPQFQTLYQKSLREDIAS